MVDLVSYFDEAFDEFKENMKNDLVAIGEEAVEDCIREGNYQDRSGKLRKSNVYAVTDDGIFKSNATDESMDAIIKRDTEGVSIILANSMPYASYVEAKGFNVQSMQRLKIKNQL